MEKKLSCLLSKLRSYFQRFGYWCEPYGDYLFYGKVKVTTVHTTFFLEDYRFHDYLYLFGKDATKFKGLEELKNLSDRLINTTGDHRTSTFTLLLFGEKTQNFQSLYMEKSILFGFKGKKRLGICFLSDEIECPCELKDVKDFLLSLVGRG
ncbi:MAG: hypothetical protein ABGX12_06885 [Desulfurobacteriaceae bacterium]